MRCRCLKRYYRIPYSEEFIKFILENLEREPFKERKEATKPKILKEEIRIETPLLESRLGDTAKELLQQYRAGRPAETIKRIIEKNRINLAEEDIRILNMLMDQRNNQEEISKEEI